MNEIVERHVISIQLTSNGVPWGLIRCLKNWEQVIELFICTRPNTVSLCEMKW